MAECNFTRQIASPTSLVDSVTASHNLRVDGGGASHREAAPRQTAAGKK